ncbi:MAG: hypothetical protein WEC17_02895 [Candidatus Saccharimonadales bacterium]
MSISEGLGHDLKLSPGLLAPSAEGIDRVLALIVDKKDKISHIDTLEVEGVVSHQATELARERSRHWLEVSSMQFVLEEVFQNTDWGMILDQLNEYKDTVEEN